MLALAYHDTSSWDRTWISKINMFVHDISSSYHLFELADNYFEMSYSMDISLNRKYNQNVCTWYTLFLCFSS